MSDYEAMRRPNIKAAAIVLTCRLLIAEYEKTKKDPEKFLGLELLLLDFLRKRQMNRDLDLLRQFKSIGPKI